MVYPGTEIEVKDLDWMWKYMVLYRYKPEMGMNVGFSWYRGDTPEEVVKHVRHIMDCRRIMDYVGTFRLDSENHRVISVEVRLAV